MNLKRIYARAIFWPTWGWNILLGRILGVRKWWNQIDDNVFLGARPFASDIPKLRQLGVQSVVNTCEEFPGHTKLYRELGIDQMYIPTTDFQPPSLPQIEQAVQFINESVAQGKKVYVHCKAGRARSATVVLCWLAKSRHWDARRAQEHLLKCRPHVNRRLIDRKVVQDFVDRLPKTSAKPDRRPAS